MASYSGRVREVETWYENTVSQSLRTALPDRSKQLHQVAWNRSLGDADLFAEKMKLEFSVSEVMVRDKHGRENARSCLIGSTRF